MNKPRGLYLAYNKKIATESQSDFNFPCMTTHALAYKYTMKGSKRTIANFSVRDIKEDLLYTDKANIVKDVNNFTLSRYLNIEDFTINKLSHKYWYKMIEGSIPISHNGYLKLFHIELDKGLLNGRDIDLLFIDEIGDANEVTLEIIKLLPAKKKVVAGDQYQQIYSFNGTVNGFEILNYPTMNLTNSFRCSPEIGEIVNDFLLKHNINVGFKGVNYNTPEFNTELILHRTNSNLLYTMQDLVDKDIDFTTTRDIKSYFRLPISLIMASAGKEVYYTEHKWLEYTYKDYKKLRNPVSFVGYLSDTYYKDTELKAAINLMLNRKVDVFRLYNLVKDYKGKSNINISTIHSSKGMTVNSVKLASDVKLNPDLDDFYTEKLLRYVAISRGQYKIEGLGNI